MDTVDSIRANTEEPLDVPKVKTLVVRTYEEQGIRVSECVIDQAIAAATDVLAPAGTVLESSTWWQHKLFPNREELRAVDRARLLLGTLKRHRLLDQQELLALFRKEEQAFEQLQRQWRQEAEQDQKENKRLLRREKLVGRLGTVGFGCLTGFTTHWLVGLFPALLGLGLVELLDDTSGRRRGPAKPDIEKYQQTLRVAAKAFNEHDFTNWTLSTVLAQFFRLPWLYNSEIVSDHASYHWVLAREQAKAHPALAQVWAHWLASNKPLRHGDFKLFQNAYDEVKKAQASLASARAEPLGNLDLSRRQAMLQEIKKYT